MTRDLIASRYIEQQATLEEHRSRYAESTTREILLDGEGVPVQVQKGGFDIIDWDIIKGPHGDDLAIPAAMRIRCDVVFDDTGLDLLAPGEVAQRSKLSVDDENIGTSPFVLAVPAERDWDFFDMHWYLRQRPQLTIEALEVDQDGHGEAILEWERFSYWASSEPFTYSHDNFDTPPSEASAHPDADPGAATRDDVDAWVQDIAQGDRLLLIKTADDYIGKKARNRLEDLDPGDDPFIDFLERTLGRRELLPRRLATALETVAEAHGIETATLLDGLDDLEAETVATLLEGTLDETRDTTDLVAEHLLDDDATTDDTDQEA